ncbi:endonuclease/exonuclease/phosphatase family protein [Streptomyces sp. AK08-02]|uniref:endonuclease/exonuclease/phosphatase family protein n=1 Tax=Streptomyces sp. AK08-02 TaxID=3028654 RepID=UPI0029BADE5C|nr:endonuclease/exonuclease/phosphatase family protein [Streptomyces sp. AK08-02]MDX3745626.1 endonuclease/exonuclease/phosphatase family protein [Streptomyces sp. AK08-02]
MMLGRGARLLAGVLTVACVVLVGSRAPGDDRSGSSLPVEAVRDVVPNRVMTWNICNPCKESNVDRAAEIARYAPQVIGLQEACVGDVEQIRKYLRNLHGLVYHVEYGSVLKSWGRCRGVPWNPGGFGQAILSAAPMTDRVKVEYPDGGSEDRGYLAVTTMVGGQRVRVFNTHLAQRRQETVRAGQTRVLAAEVSRHKRAIVIGDFNAVADAPELTRMWALAVDADPECHASAAATCEPTTDWNSKFDYIFLRGITPLRQRVQPTSYSDHHLVYSDLDLT